MSKLRRDAGAFAQRVRMGSDRLWILVEGKTSDTPFYDRVAQTIAELPRGSHSVLPVSQLSLGGQSAGGKPFAASLHAYFLANSMLIQHSNSGPHFISFGLDRDYDQFFLSSRDEVAIVYTRSCDVESEILMHGQIHQALCSTFSLAARTATQILAGRPGLAVQLSTIWSEWLALRAVAVRFGIGLARYGGNSEVNDSVYGELDITKYAAARDATLTAAGEYRDEADELLGTVRAQAARGEGAHLVKGKAIARFAYHLVKTSVDEGQADTSVRADTLTKSCLATLDFEEIWADHYRDSFRAILMQSA